MEWLKAQPCKKAVSSLFVCLLRIMLFAKCCLVELEGLVVDLGTSGMFQSPLVVFRVPLIMICPSLMMSTWYLVKRAMQLSSQSWPIEMRDPWRSSKKNCRLVPVWKGRLIMGLSPAGKIPCGCRWQLGRRVRTSCDDGRCSGAWRRRQDSGCWLRCRGWQ